MGHKSKKCLVVLQLIRIFVKAVADICFFLLGIGKLKFQYLM